MLKRILQTGFLILLFISPSFAHDSGIPGHTPYSLFDETRKPTANDDITEGFSPGSLWLNVTNLHQYVCVDSTAGAAIWKRMDFDENEILTFADPTILTFESGNDPMPVVLTFNGKVLICQDCD